MTARAYTLTDDLLEVCAIVEAISQDRWGPRRDRDAPARTSEVQHDAAQSELGRRHTPEQVERLLILCADEGWVRQDAEDRWALTGAGTWALNHPAAAGLLAA